MTMPPPRRKLPAAPSALQQSTRHLIKACVRSGHPWTWAQRGILKDMLADVNKFGRLPKIQHKMLMIYAKRCGVAT